MKHSFLSFFAILFSFSFAFSQAPWHLDSTFNDDGISTLDFGESYESVFSIAVQADGKIVTGGFTEASGKQKYAVSRYLVDGTLDNTFNGTGSNTHHVGTEQLDVIYSIAIQIDGKIVAAGRSFNSQPAISVARYNVDGTLDNTFSGDGKLTTDPSAGGYGGEAQVVKLQADGKILVAGGAFDGSNQYFAVTRYLTDGTLDNTFGGDGIVTTDIFVYNSNEYANGLLIQPDGKIILTGSTYNTIINDVEVAAIRYNADGSLDVSFDGDGITTGDIGDTQDYMFCSALQADGKIIVAGFSVGSVADDDYDMSITRFNPDGSFDTGFDGDGKRIIDLTPDEDDVINAIAIQDDGKILLVGYNTTSFENHFTLTRLNSNGSTDIDFGVGGTFVSDFSPFDIGLSVAIQPDGKILAGGTTENYTGDTDMLLLRYSNEEDEPQTVENMNTISTIQVFPNPAHHNISLNFNLLNDAYLSFGLKDIYGKNITTFNQNVFYIAGNNKIQFSLPAGIASGTYFIAITNGGEIKGIPVIVE